MIRLVSTVISLFCAIKTVMLAARDLGFRVRHY
jgi:hypothetical protein